MEWELQTSTKSPLSHGTSVFPEWPQALGRLLWNRGFRSQTEVSAFLSPSIQSLKDPFQILGMEKACERLYQAFQRQEKICIYADFDLDGTSGCALLKKGLDSLGFQNVLVYQPRRLKDGYGFHAPIVEELASQGIKLIVTCDVGITAHKACERAESLGLDVILTDHHLPAEILPPAFVIVNPNQPQDQSGLGYLSGAGVGFTLLRALKRYLTDRKAGTPEKLNLKDLLDCLTIATLTDMVPLVEDNRVLVQWGLKSLAQTQRPGLRALLEALNLSHQHLKSSDVAIRFAPKLNALSRLEGDVLPLDLYLVEDPQKAMELVEQALRQNQERVQLQGEALREALEQAQSQIEAPFILVYSENFHRGVIGLIATSLSQATGKPCFVASLDAEEKKMVGSCRLPENLDGSLVKALSSVGPYLLRHGGHARAAGFEAALSEIDSIKRGLRDYFSSEKTSVQKIYYDETLDFTEFDFRFMEFIDRMEPFGVGFERPLFLFQNVELQKIQTLKGGHLKMSLSQSSQSRDAILFSPTENQKKVLTELSQNPRSFDVIAEVQLHEWRGRKSLQLMLEDVRIP